MATRRRRRERVVHQRSPDAKLAAVVIYRQRAEHERRDAPGADVPQPHGPDQPTSRYGRQGKAFGGRASVAQALAGARMAVFAKAGIEQRFAHHDVRGTLRPDHERSGVGNEGNLGLPQSGHGTSVSTPQAMRPRSVVGKSAGEGVGAGAPAPGFLAPSPARGGGEPLRTQMW